MKAESKRIHHSVCKMGPHPKEGWDTFTLKGPGDWTKSGEAWHHQGKYGLETGKFTSELFIRDEPF